MRCRVPDVNYPKPSTDSSLTIPPHFWRDGGKTQREWLDATEKFRLIRGNVIAEAYDLENKLGELVAEIFYPTIPWHQSHDREIYESHNHLRLIFSRTLIQPSGFSRRIELFRVARQQLPQIADVCSDDLLLQLDKARTVRNRFAHDPIQFEFTPPPESQIRALLVSRDRTDEITTEYVFANWRLFCECSSAMTDCLVKLQARFDKFSAGRR